MLFSHYSQEQTESGGARKRAKTDSAFELICCHSTSNRQCQSTIVPPKCTPKSHDTSGRSHQISTVTVETCLHHHSLHIILGESGQRSVVCLCGCCGFYFKNNVMFYFVKLFFLWFVCESFSGNICNSCSLINFWKESFLLLLWFFFTGKTILHV